MAKQQKNNTQQQPPAAPPLSESDRIRERKRKVIDTINEKFYQPIWMERLLKMCGNDQSKIMKALNSFVTYILADKGGNSDNKVYIADCTISSICTAFLEAFQMGIEVGGGRDHAYLINYSGQCELDISYKGFVYALNKHFDNAFVDARCVFEGDEFSCEITDTTATFTHKPKNAFVQTWEKMQGCYCYFTYTLRGGGKVSRLIMIPKGEDAKTPDSLEMIRSKAKGSWAWKDFPFEQCKKATIRRGSKIPFASIDFADDDINPETVDNRHYELEPNSGDKLRLMMEKHKEMLEDEKPNDNKGSGEAAPLPAVAPDGGEQAENAANGDQPAEAMEGDIIPPAAPSVAPVPSAAPDDDIEEGFKDISDDDFETLMM